MTPLAGGLEPGDGDSAISKTNVYTKVSLLTACFLFLQMKKVFSANPEATINVECIMDDIDVAGRLSRDVFEEKSASVLERARAPLQKVMLAAPIALC